MTGETLIVRETDPAAMWQFVAGVAVGSYIGTYYNMRPYFEMGKQYYQRYVTDTTHKSP